VNAGNYEVTFVSCSLFTPSRWNWLHGRSLGRITLWVGKFQPVFYVFDWRPLLSTGTKGEGKRRKKSLRIKFNEEIKTPSEFLNSGHSDAGFETYSGICVYPHDPRHPPGHFFPPPGISFQKYIIYSPGLRPFPRRPVLRPWRFLKKGYSPKLTRGGLSSGVLVWASGSLSLV